MLLDLELEESNGYDFLLKNRKIILDELKIKVLFVTGNISSNLFRDAFRLGVREIIKKPYVIEELILKIEKYNTKEKNIILEIKKTVIDC